MTAALQPFNRYITDLANGQLDDYFNSTQTGTLVTNPDLKLLNGPILLLHSLGNYPDDARLPRLFQTDTVFVSF